MTQMALGAWQAQVLYTLTELGIFELLAEKPLPAQEVARRSGTHPLAAEGLLNAGVALKLLAKDGEEYADTDLALRLLCEESPESLARWVRVMGRWSRPWNDLAEVVRTGQPAEGREARLWQDPRYVADFVLGMHEYARRIADEVAEHVDLPAGARVTDVGGGAGTYAIALCRRHPDVTVRILELASVVPLAESTVAEAGLADRIAVAPGDYLADPFGAGVSAVLLSNVLHQESREAGESIVARAHRALRAGGKVVVNGYFLDETRTRPSFTTLHNLSAFTLWGGGRSYTVGEAARLLQDAGFTEPVVHQVAQGASTVLVAQKGADGQPSADRGE
ncbi:methyltransferase [Streptomyces hiroshimensis]|uniref:methyltransferase n=1 Tax=Streptomyces hiroshimensis TaxID=66424 RepID=UPI00167B7E8B